MLEICNSLLLHISTAEHEGTTGPTSHFINASCPEGMSTYPSAIIIQKVLILDFLHVLFPCPISGCLLNDSLVKSDCLWLKIPKKTSTNGQESFSYRGAKLWSSLPNKAKQSPSICPFENNL